MTKPRSRQSRPGGRSRDDLSAKVLIIGDVPGTRQLTELLEADGVVAVKADDAHMARAETPEIAPEVVVTVQRGHDLAEAREVGDQVSSSPALIVIGGTNADDAAPQAGDLGFGEDHLPADVSPSEIAQFVISKLDEPARPAQQSRRAALSEQRLLEEARRELQRAKLSGRPGMIAVVSVAELDQLSRDLGSQADEALAKMMDQWLVADGHILEQHSVRSGGGFFVLMPETSVAAGRERLRALARDMSGAVLDIGSEMVRVTPMIGFAAFDSASGVARLRSNVSLALDEAAQHLDLRPVEYSDEMRVTTGLLSATRDRLADRIDRARVPLQIAFTFALVLTLPFIIYVISWELGFDLTSVTYPLVAVALAVTAGVLWIESFRAVGQIDAPELVGDKFPTGTAIIAAYLPNEAATIVETVSCMLRQDYPGDLQVILAYNSPRHLPVEDTLKAMAASDPRLQLLRVSASTSKAQNVNAAIAHVRGQFVGVFDADHHPAPGSFERAWRWLSNDHDIVQGHCVVRNGSASWVARMVAVEFETIYAVSHPGRARLHGFGIFGGSNGYWRTESLRQIRMHGSMLTEDIDSSMRSLLEGFSIVSDPSLVSTELAPTSMPALWNQRARWAQGWTQNSRIHLRPALSNDRLSLRQKIGALFLLGWTQVVPWVTMQVIPILAFTIWRDGGLSGINLLIPLFALLTIFTLSVGLAQTVFAYVLGDPLVRQHRRWFLFYAVNSTLWYGEFKNVISRVAQIKEALGERQWRVTPRGAQVRTELSVDTSDDRAHAAAS